MPFNDPFYQFFNELSNAFDDVNRAYEQFPTPRTRNPWFSKSGDKNTFTPSLNVHETDKAYKLHLSAPGASKQNLQIDFDKLDNKLTIKGEVPELDSEKPVYREISSGKFERSVKLPSGVDAENIKARFADGILTLDVPKKEPTEGHQKISID